jgi:hypothetical protein
VSNQNSLHTSSAKRDWQLKKIIALTLGFSDLHIKQKAEPLLTPPFIV